jgi:hypothetical protein
MRERLLPLLLVGALLFCHGVFGVLHLICYPLECADDVWHATEHQPAARMAGDTHEHPASHATNTEYFAVLAFGLLVLLSRFLSKGAWLRIGLGMHWAAVLRLAPAVHCSARSPTSPVLQVFRF